MKRTLARFVVAMLAMGLGACGPVEDEAPPSRQQQAVALAASPPLPERLHTAQPRIALGEVILKFRDGVRGAQRAPIAVAGRSLQHIRHIGYGAELWRFDVTDDQAAEQHTLVAIAELRARPDIEYAHENARMEFFAVPNDPLFPSQWNYSAINAPIAWNYVTGNITVAVIDSGSLDHPDLSGKWRPGYDATDGDSVPTDDGTWHHGIHVAGLIAADTNNGIGGAGLCWGCSIVPIKISAHDNFYTDKVPDALSHAVQLGARVVNMSFGTDLNNPCSGFPEIQAAVTSAVNKQVVVVAAAGNWSGDTAGVTPASCNGVIAVAASDRTGKLAPYSDRGTRVDLTAPGGGVDPTNGQYGAAINCPANRGTDTGPYGGTTGAVSSWVLSKAVPTLQPSDYCYRYLSGTSMAAPHVVGVVALLLSQFPGLTPARVLERLRGAAHPISGCTTGCGAGLIDAGASVYSTGDSPCRADGDMCTSSASTCRLKGGIVIPGLPCGNPSNVCCAL